MYIHIHICMLPYKSIITIIACMYGTLYEYALIQMYVKKNSVVFLLLMFLYDYYYSFSQPYNNFKYLFYAK